MILEGLVTTLGRNGEVNLAPMGPEVAADGQRLVLRPFKSSRTYSNLLEHRECVFHVTDDVELLARAALGPTTAPLVPALAIRGWRLADACRAHELRVTSFDSSRDRAVLEAEIVRTDHLRPFFGLNRAKHAVVEAAILATRVSFLPRQGILDTLTSLRPLVDKTGGPAEARAFGLLEQFIRGAPRPAANRVTVRTGARLHFGLVAPGGKAARRFGGVGAMLAGPGVVVSAEKAATFSVEGPQADRAAQAARAAAGDPAPPVHVRVLECPALHAGLGVGTQLAMATARAVDQLLGGEHSAVELAGRVGRGQRSGIGVHGLVSGGLLVDGGRGPETGVAPLIARHPIPASWRFLLAAPRGLTGRSGKSEESAFGSLVTDGAGVEGTGDHMARILMMEVLPALLEGDLASFGAALDLYGRFAGEQFRSEQGGTYASPAIEHLVELFRRAGSPGAGQSSWGPTVFALAAGEAEARAIAERVERSVGDLEGPIRIEAPLNTGAGTIIE